MKAYIQTDKRGDFYNVNAFLAAVGFNSLGFETQKYVDTDDVQHKERDSIFVGGVGMIRKRLSYLGIDKPEEIE
ncbi:MAG: DUF4343 domain-containing protein, partial [Bacteroidota bacterium]